MNPGQIEHVEKNLVRLIRNTICNVQLLSKLQESGVLSHSDYQDVRSEKTDFEKSRRLYEILLTKTGAFEIVIAALKETLQSGAYEILQQLDSNFQDYGLISIDMRQELGKGRSGTRVYRGMFDKREVAVKIVKEEPELALKEVNILRELDDHENIVRHFIAELKNDKVYIALELCLINLEEEIRMKVVKPEPKHVLKKSTCGIAFLHKNRIIHRDLKPANILLNRHAQVKISDFGFSKQLNAGMSSTSVSGVCGTLDWMAPEVLSCVNVTTNKQNITDKVDIFALGCVFYYVLSNGHHLFGDEFDRPRNILNNTPQWGNTVHDDNFKELILKMISHLSTQRPSADDILRFGFYSSLNMSSETYQKQKLTPANETLLVQQVEFGFSMTNQTGNNQLHHPTAVVDPIGSPNIDICIANTNTSEISNNSETVPITEELQSEPLDDMTSLISIESESSRANDTKGSTVLHFAIQDGPSTKTNDGNRETWDNPIEFVMSCISMSVSFCNVCRFPAVAAKNGGGAFLISYLIVLGFIGQPLYYLELCIGQFSSSSQVKVWNMAPIFKGVGYGSISGVIYHVSYYCVLTAIPVRFLFSSFAMNLPWLVCHQDKHPDIPCEPVDQDGGQNLRYFIYTVFPVLPDFKEGIGKLHWQLALCLVFVWVTIFFSLIKGIKISGKVAYFTAMFPYVVLLSLLIRGVTRKGAWNGIRILLEPEWKKLYDSAVWFAAVEQCLFSLPTGYGSVIAFSSYNGFRQNVYKYALIISFLNTGTSVLASVIAFSVLGNFMEVTGRNYSQIKAFLGGPGLAYAMSKKYSEYLKIAEVIASCDTVPQLFAALFLFMLFTLGLGSATSFASCVITIVCDQFPLWRRWLVTLVVCIAGCLVGLMYVTEGGFDLLILMSCLATLIVYVMAIAECAGISYFYGLNNICNDIEFMLGRFVGIYCRLCWGFIIPVGLTAALLYYFIHNPVYSYPTFSTSATICGWLLTGFAIAQIPIWGIHLIVSREGKSFREKFRLACTPTNRWGPQAPELRERWLEFKRQKDAEGYKFKIW